MLLCLCGEIQPPVTFSGCYLGSSPLTRGILVPGILKSADIRFTPAHAGNTHPEILFLLRLQVHPRSRGEYMWRVKIMPDLKGSPPLTRGIPFFGMYVCVHVGFTPAHAGNTASSEIASTKPRVHPRSRGEYTKKSLILSHFFQHPFSHFI